MTPFYEGFIRAQDVLRANERTAEPIDHVVVKPQSVGYRVGRGLVSLGAHLMGTTGTTKPASSYELAA